MKGLDIGCGCNKTPGFIGMDINPRSDADVFHSVNTIPYPFCDDEFDEIFMNHVIEHVDDFFAVMQEIYRIIKPTGKIYIRTPHFSSLSSFTDPSHRIHLSSESFRYFYPGDCWSFYTTAKFRCQVEVIMERYWRLLGVQWLINKFPRLRGVWEIYAAFVVRASELRFVLEPIK